MTTTVTRGLLLQAVILLSQARLDKCTVDERIKIVRTLRQARPEADEMQGFISDLQQKSADIIADGDKAAIAKLDKTIAEEAARPAATDGLTPLTEATIQHLVESNDGWTPAAVMTIEDVFAPRT